MARTKTRVSTESNVRLWIAGHTGESATGTRVVPVPDGGRRTVTKLR